MSTDVKKPASADRIPVKHLYFTKPMTFPGSQETHVPCSAEPAATNRSYVATYVVSLGCFEFTCYDQGKVQADRMIPVTMVEMWERAQ